MTDYKTLRVPEDKYHAAKEQKEANDRTWGEQIVRPSDDAEDESEDTPVALSYEDVVAASEQGARNALEDYQ